MNRIKKFLRGCHLSILYIFTVKSFILFNLSVPDPFISDLTILLNGSSQILERKK